jgi:hypothetical protein
MEMIDWSNFSSSVLVEVTTPKKIQVFSGVAINPKTILTTAKGLKGDITKVRASWDSKYSKNGNFIEVNHVENHPDSEFGIDLAKIRLFQDLPKTIVYYPIIKRDQLFQGRILRIGFGTRNKNNIRTLIHPFIKKILPSEKILILNDLYSFSGDSGGPVFLQNAGQMYLVAIHSKKTSRVEGKYSFNTLLSSQREWIMC